MRLLLDTHIALWAITDSPKLGVLARELILSPENMVFVSAVSLWEIALKHALSAQGRGDMPVTASRAAELFAAAGYESLAVSWAHSVAISALPQQPAHADPFDRMLIAQARSEAMTLLTRDTDVAAYGERVMRV